MSKKPSAKTAASNRDLDVWFEPSTDGRDFGVRVVTLDDGRQAYMPKRLFIRVAPDVAAGTPQRDPGVEVKTSVRPGGFRVPADAHQLSAFHTGRQIVIDADTTENGNIEIRAITVSRADGSVKAGDLTKNMRIREWAERGLEQATGTMTALRSEPDDLRGHLKWSYGREVGQEISDRVRARPPIGRGRRKPIPAVERAGELHVEGKNFSEIRLAIQDEFGLERSERTIRRWIDDIRKGPAG
jgi:hypothetical protein